MGPSHSELSSSAAKVASHTVQNLVDRVRPGSLLPSGYPREYLALLGSQLISGFSRSFPTLRTSIPALTPLIRSLPPMPALLTSWQPSSLAGGREQEGEGQEVMELEAQVLGF